MNSNLPDFDPYYRWLGLPKGQCPPTHYQLLEISPTEDDRPAIEAAINRQRGTKLGRSSFYVDTCGFFLGIRG